MKHYYFNNYVGAHGRHEIHAEDCPFLPYLYGRTYIGDFSNCNDALQRAKALHPEKSFVCCPLCSSC